MIIKKDCDNGELFMIIKKKIVIIDNNTVLL